MGLMRTHVMALHSTALDAHPQYSSPSTDVVSLEDKLNAIHVSNVDLVRTL